MGIQDRRRAAGLVEQEFRARRNALHVLVTDQDVEARGREILKRFRMSVLTQRLEKLRAEVSAIESDLAEWAAGIAGPKAEKRYRNGCECHKSYEERLREVAMFELNAEADRKSEINKLNRQEREILAQIECSQTPAEIQKALKRAGLVG